MEEGVVGLKGQLGWDFEPHRLALRNPIIPEVSGYPPMVSNYPGWRCQNCWLLLVNYLHNL